MLNSLHGSKTSTLAARYGAARLPEATWPMKGPTASDALLVLVGMDNVVADLDASFRDA